MPQSSAPSIPHISPLSTLSGVGPARAKALAELGVHTLGDLLDYFPRDYQYESAEIARDFGRRRVRDCPVMFVGHVFNVPLSRAFRH